MIFSIKDYSGRGGASTWSLAEIKAAYGDEINEDEDLKEFLDSAQIGDQFNIEESATTITRID